MGQGFRDLLEAKRQLKICRKEVDRLSEELARLKQSDPPGPPQSAVTISSSEALDLLRPYNIIPSGGAEDLNYLLVTRDEANRFMAWYKENAPIKPGDYTPDDLDCGDFAWIMRAFALIWSKGKYLWGYTESEGVDVEYSFPNHGFCFLILDDKTVWFADALRLAAPDDEIAEAYPVKCYAAKC